MNIRNWFDRAVFGFTTLFNALGVELPKRSGIQFTGLSIADDEANDRLIVGPAFPTEQEEFTSGVVTIDSDRTILVESPPATLFIAPAPDELHKDGAQKVLLLYPETITTLGISPALNVRGDFTVDAVTGAPVGWDDELWTIIAVTRAGPKFATMAIQFADIDEGIPTVLSATVYGAAPDEIEVVYSKRCVAYETTGLQLSSGAGLSVAPGMALSGNGTATHVYALTDALSGDEVFDLSVLPSRKVQSINGPLVTVSTVAVTLLFGPDGAMLGAIHLWRNDQRTLSGADVLTLTDQIGGAPFLMTSGTTKPTTTTLGTLAAPAMQLASGAYLAAPTFAAENMTTGAICIILEATSAADRGLVVGGNGTTFETLLYVAGGGGTLLGASNQAQTGGLSAAATLTGGRKAITFTWDGSGREQYVNGVLNDSDTTDAVTPTITEWVIGALLDHTTLVGGTWKIGEVQICNVRHDAGDHADLVAWAAAHYGT